MPLPKPKAGETLDEFLDRCPFDTRMLIEFEDEDQRFAVCRSLYEESQTKAFRLEAPKINRGEFISSWNKQIKKAEWNQFLKWFKYFKSENYKAIDKFIRTRDITNFNEFFKDGDIIKLYEELFEDTGTQIALWHTRTFEKYVSKNQTESNWRNTFSAYGQRFGADKVRLVSDNRKKELQSVLKRLMSDPDFQNMNERQAQRVLRSRFNGYSKSQAQRLIRTEVGAAANYASVQSANSLFGSDGYKKEWLTAIDDRERPSHNAANGQRVDSTEPFIVGGEQLQFPKDPAASAKNRINCRCTILTYPINSVERIEDRDTEGLVSDISFGISGADPVSVGTEIAQAIAEVVATGEVGGSIREAKIKEYIEKNRPENWEDVKKWAFKNSTSKDFTELNEDILEFIDQDKLKTFIISNRETSYHSYPSRKIVYGTESWKEAYTTVYHEIGHHIHWQTRMFLSKDAMSRNLMQDEWKAFYTKFGVGARGKRKQAIEDRLGKIFPNTKTSEGYREYKRIWSGRVDFDTGDYIQPEWKTMFAKEIEELGENVVYEQLMDLADTAGAFTKNKFGWGHRNSYYRGSSGAHQQMAEVFAHMTEWRFSDATMVKKVFPELYEDSMKLYDELIEAIRQERGY